MPHLSPTLNKVDSKAMEWAIRKLPTHKQRWVTKQITGQFAHGKNMQQRGQRATAKCPRCETELEDKLHILQCKAPGAQQQWMASIEKLRIWMQAQGMEPTIQQAILQNLEAWVQDQPPQLEYSSTPFGKEQASIGWERILDGWLLQYWRVQQEQAWSQIRLRKSSRRWTAALIQKL